MKISFHFPRRAARGSSIVEFAFVCFELFLLMFAGLEFARMVLVYTNLASSARVALRYAVVHGSSRTGSGADGPASVTDIQNVVVDYAKSGLVNTSKLVITTTWLDAGLKSPGSRVQVTVKYPYDPFTLLPLKVTIGTTTEGVITF